MPSATSITSRPGRNHRHIKALAAIRARREAVKNKTYIAKRREFTV
ncbi:hypothetical protein J2X12_004146 [Pseudarthrobacter oxydans]|uniref:Uncharacterized protein n=1 Tax=Pseudarthrobacter oxydans TaxID=1671 RepID=A0AAW8NFG6_PSEOX|nr:hypothetical protein [Pseudarthrobacter oxydans]MDR7166092.1 hypothetical protein [Pseudarthrobacter oxydans]